MSTIYDQIYLTGEELLKSETSSPEALSLCAFERLRYKIVLGKKSVLRRDEVLMYARLCLADNNDEIPYSLVIDLNSLRKKNDEEAIYLIGLFYLKGIKPYGKDDVQAFSCFQKAFDEGLQKASVKLGECYFKGIGCERDYEKAKQMLLLNNEDKKCFTYLGFIYLNEENEEGWKLLTKANGMEEKESFYYLGQAYFDERFHHQDFDKARLLFRVGSDLGEPKCHLLAGKLCLTSTDPFLKSLSKIYLERAGQDKEALELLGDIAKSEEDITYYSFYQRSYENGGDGKKYADELLMDKETQKEGLSILKKLAKKDDQIDMELYHFYLEHEENKAAIFHLKRAFYRGNAEATEIITHKNKD